MSGDNELLNGELSVINVGLDTFADPLWQGGVPVVDLDWRPPARGDPRLIDLLRRLQGVGNIDIDRANLSAHKRIVEAEPALVDVVAAGEAIPELQDRVLLHAGPPIGWDEMCEPMRGAIIGAVRYEGWTTTEAEAAALAARGELTLLPNHDYGAVGPMTGITTRSMPVFVVENRTFGNRAFCTINEGVGAVLRFGANNDEVIERLEWLRETLAPTLREALRRADGIELRPLIARALTMGDELHQRNVAASSLFLREITPLIAQGTEAGASLAEIVSFLAGNEQFFLNLAMAASKAAMDPVADIPGSTVVSAMSRNGSEFGIRVGGTGGQWFLAPTPMPEGLYFPGYSAQDANPDMGDSAILETLGLGAFAMGGAPAVAGFVGAGTFRDALDYTREMGEITIGPNPHLGLPTLDFAGVPCGIDIRKVVETGICPAINTGIAHRRAGVGQVGAGIARAPFECFAGALEELANRSGA